MIVFSDKEKYKALVVQITMLEKLMDNYKVCEFSHFVKFPCIEMGNS